jgi:hypothetical protein
MRRGAEDLHAAGGQIDNEHRVVRDEASPRPDFRREEIGTGGYRRADPVRWALVQRPGGASAVPPARYRLAAGMKGRAE